MNALPGFRSFWSSPVRGWLLALTLLVVGAGADALAAPMAFNVPAQPASAALVAFAKQAGVEVLFSFDDLKKVRSSEVVGSFEPSAALERLLHGTGFRFTRNANGKFIVLRENLRAGVGELRGVVVALESGDPVAHATVSIGEEPAVAVRTRADGRFVFRDLAPGTHAVVIAAEEYATTRIAEVKIDAGRRLELGSVRLVAGRDRPQQMGELVVNAEGLGAVSAPMMLALQEMIVTPSRYGIEEERGSIAASLTETDLLALPQFGEDLYRAISRLPGLAADDLTARFWVRGAPHDYLLARLDGVRLVEPFHLKDTDSSLSILDLETISRLNLYTGGFTAEFGDRLAGVVTMETDSHARAQPRTTLGLSLIGARAATRGRTPNGRGRWLVSARSGYPDILLEQSDGTGNNVLRPRYHDLMGKWEWQVTPDHVVSVHALHAGDRMFFQDRDGPLLTSRYDSDYFWARWQGSFGWLSGEAVLSHAGVSRRRDAWGFNEEIYALQIQDYRDLRLLALRNDWEAGLSERVLLRGGFEVEEGKAHYDYAGLRDTLALRGGVFRVERQTRSVRLDESGRSLRAHFSTRVQPLPALTLEAGVRYDRNDFADDSDVSPRFTAAWRAGRTTLRAAWGRYHQAQGLHQLSVRDGDTRYRGSEQAEHRILGLEHRLAVGINLRLEGYERTVRRPRPHWENVVDAADVFPEFGRDRLLLDPVRMRARGVELIAERRGAGKFTWSASYALARSEETLRPGVTIPRARDQKHTFYADLYYTPNTRWQFSMAWQQHTGWPTTERQFTRVPLAGGGVAIIESHGPVNGLRLPGYHRVDFRIQRRFVLKRGVLRAHIDVFNVFHHHNRIEYAYHLNNDASGRLVVNRVPGETLFPRLPSAGLTWDF